jgi:MFS family permease
MNWNDYEAIWKRQELPVGVHADFAVLRETFEKKRRRLSATLFARDLLEAAAGVFVSGVFAYTWWQMGRGGWPMAFAIALILGVSGFFVRERVRAHRLQLGADVPLIAKVEADIAELRHQRRLLLNIWSWYLLPCIGAIAIFGATVVRLLIVSPPPGVILSALWEHPAALAWIILYVAVILPLCFWGVWTINRRAVRKQLEPRLEELEKLHRELRSSS